MTSTMETGHSKNVANFDELISSALGFGTDYDPTKESLKILSMQATSALAKKAIAGVNDTLPLYSNAIAEREAAFLPLSKLATRLLNALKATDTSKQVIDNALTIIRKLQGRRATPKKTEAEKKELATQGVEIKEISSSQMSYNNRLENFDKLIKLLLSVPLYNPNEADLKTTSLTALLNGLRTKNSAVLAANTPLNNARLLRNNVLYNNVTGLVDTAMGAKSYIKSVFGATSPQYRLVANLEFAKIKI